jgi:hypothetical protein
VSREITPSKIGVNLRRDDISDFTASSLAVYPPMNTTLAQFATDTAEYTQ